MPGATTARLVVCDFEMPTKLSMMPHTVPNRPMNGAQWRRSWRAPRCRAMPSRQQRLDPLQPERDRVFDAVAPEVRPTPRFRPRRGSSARAVLARGSMLEVELFQLAASVASTRRATQAAAGQRHFSHLAEQDSPGVSDASGSRTQSSLHDEIRRQQHLPWRQIGMAAIAQCRTLFLPVRNDEKVIRPAAARIRPAFDAVATATSRRQ